MITPGRPGSVTDITPFLSIILDAKLIVHLREPWQTSPKSSPGGAERKYLLAR